MQARHFNHLARSLNKQVHLLRPEYMAGFNDAVLAVIHTCKHFNPSFDATRFRAVVYAPAPGTQDGQT